VAALPHGSTFAPAGAPAAPLRRRGQALTKPALTPQVLYDSIAKLTDFGVSATDVKKLTEAGFNTVQSLSMCTRKVRGQRGPWTLFACRCAHRVAARAAALYVATSARARGGVTRRGRQHKRAGFKREGALS